MERQTYKRILGFSLAPTLMLAGLLTFTACGGCDPSSVVKVKDLVLASASTQTTPTTIDVGCFLYVFQVAWHGYKNAHAFYRIGQTPTGDPVHDDKIKYTTLSTPYCGKGACKADARETRSKKEDAFLAIEPAKGERFQETAQAVCRISIFGSDGAQLAIANAEKYPRHGTEGAACSIDF